jgi:hypothetical protein
VAAKLVASRAVLSSTELVSVSSLLLKIAPTPVAQLQILRVTQACRGTLVEIAALTRNTSPLDADKCTKTCLMFQQVAG